MTDLTFDFYKLLVEEVRDARRARRELSNVFMTINLGGVGALGFLAANQIPNSGKDLTLFGLCAFALVMTCIMWRTSNRYYTLMLAAKYKTIYRLEDELGVHPIRDEWQALQGKRATMKWFTLERTMPLLFILGYILFFAVESGAFRLDPLVAQVRAWAAPWLAQIGIH